VAEVDVLMASLPAELASEEEQMRVIQVSLSNPLDAASTINELHQY
jgi:hypothetical protein